MNGNQLSKQLEIKNFTLKHDGGFYLLFSKEVTEYVYLTISQINEMLHIENMEVTEFDENMREFEPVTFTKVTLIPSQNEAQELDFPIMWEHPRDLVEAIEMLTVQIKRN